MDSSLITDRSSLPTRRLGVLMVVSGPSGSGKTTLCRKLRDSGKAIFSVSCTTRPPREGEVDGRDYFFLSETDFMDRVGRGEFFEYARVHGNLYGTLKSYVKQHLEAGTDVLLDIDVQGAAQVRTCEDEIIQRCLVDVFIWLSLDELKARLVGRGTEKEEVVTLRVKNAAEELDHWPRYQYRLESRTPAQDFECFQSLLIAERMRVSRVLPRSA